MPLIGSNWVSATPTDPLPETLDGPHVVAPSLEGTAGDLLQVAGSLGRERDADVLLVRPAGGPSGPLASYGRRTRIEVRPGAAAADRGTAAPVEARRTVAGCVGSVVERATTALDVQVLVARRSVATGGRPLGSIERLDCDVVLLGGGSDLDRVSSILLAVAGGPHSGLGAEVAECVAAANDAWVDVFHAVPSDADHGRRLMAEAYVGAALHLLSGYDDVDRWVLETDDPVEAIVEQSRYYDATVLGAPTAGPLRRFVFGSTTGTVADGAEGPVLTVRRNRTSGAGGHLRLV